VLAFPPGGVHSEAMPQIQLPVFPVSRTALTGELAFEQRDSQVYYFNGHLPVFTHPVEDIASFRFFTSQLIANGSASQGEISKAFGVPVITVKRACKKLRLEGAAAYLPCFTLIFDREGYSPAFCKELWEDTLKIVAYRAEPALAQILAETMLTHHRDEARGPAQQIIATAANLPPRPGGGHPHRGNP